MYGKFSLFPIQGSQYSEQVDLLFFALTAMSLFFVVVVTALIVFFAIKYRRRPGNEIAAEAHENPWLELIWSVAPLMIALVLFGWGVQLFLETRSVPPEDSLEIFAVGKQWMWKFQHPDGRREINHLHLPLGRPIKMTMISQDVIHSFYVPVFRLKQDVLPMRYSSTWFVPSKTGVFHLFCAEYCGTEHSRMGGTVTVMEPGDYEKWLASPLIEGGQPRGVSGSDAIGSTAAGASVAEGTATTDADKGKSLLDSKGCRACHHLEDVALAPKLEGIFGHDQALEQGSIKVNENYIRESILIPTAKVVKGYMPVMPPFQGQITEEEIRWIIAYIKSTSGVKQ